MIDKDLLDTFKKSISDRSFYFLEEIDSTNQFAKTHLPTSEYKALVLAKHQFKGKGQRSNSWQSQKGLNLTFTLVDPVPIPFEYQKYLLKIAYLLHYYLKTEFGLNAKVKWPNDVLVNGAKISGILVEAQYRGNSPQKLVTGIGLNVNQSLFPDLETKATSILNETGQIQNLLAVLSDFLKLFERAEEEIFHNNALEDLINPNMAFKDQMVFVQVDQKTEFKAKLLGLDDECRICFKDEDDKIRSFMHENLRIRPINSTF